MKDLLISQEQVNNFDRTMDGKEIVAEEKKKIKIHNDSPEIQHCWRDHRHLGCIRFHDTSVVLKLRSLDLFQIRMHFEKPSFGLTTAN